MSRATARVAVPAPGESGGSRPRRGAGPPRKRLAHLFSGSLRRRRALKHYARHPLIDALAGAGPAPAPADDVARVLLQAARGTADEAIARVGSHAEGLNVREAAARLAHSGPNDIEHERPLSGWAHLWHCYRDPFNLLLTALAALSLLSEDRRGTLLIGTMVALSTLIRYAQERRSRRAADRLSAMVSNTATVIRRVAGPKGSRLPGPPQTLEIARRKVVRGDLVRLAAGDMIPADCRVLEARDLFVAQAAMTGESLPVEKSAACQAESDELMDQRNLVFMGTSVVSGSATALVVATGRSTYFGALASKLIRVDVEPNAFQAGVNSVSRLLIRFALVLVPLVLLINGLTKGDWLEALLFALSVAVGLTPEMLPMVVTTTLAKGAVALSRRKVVVKRLDAIQNFGAMDVLCTDKTGTLTQDRIVLARWIDAFGRPSGEVLDFAFLNSHHQTGLKNLLDRAVLERVARPAAERLASIYSKVDEIPFDFERRRMSVVVGDPDGHRTLICKGAVEEMLAACRAVRVGTDPAELPLDDARLAQVRAVTDALNREGLRVVAVAIKQLEATRTTCNAADETELTLVGHVAFLDPPKESAAPALEALAGHGIRVMVLSGDNDLVTAHVCDHVGLGSGSVMLGAQVQELGDADLALAVERHQRYAKLAPLHKERIVRALRANGHVVGFLGDGINDAPALRAADIGISVDTAVDIAKEAADIVLLEKSLMVLDAGVVEGRSTFCNMLKYIRMTASSNFGNVFSVLVASAFLPFLPMLPLHLLTQNLLYDIAQTGIPFDHVDTELVARPLRWDPSGIGRFMLFFGPISSLFDIATFALMWWVFHADAVERQTLFQSGWFVVGLLTQTLVVHMIRTPRLPLIESRASAVLTATTLAIVAVGVFLPMGPLAESFGLQALPAAFFGWLAAIVLAYCGLTSLMKRWFVRRHGWQ